MASATGIRQGKWQLKQKLAGNCVICGKPRDCVSTVHCLKHLLMYRARYTPKGTKRGRPRIA